MIDNNHVWVNYISKYDIKDSKSFYCKICGIKVWNSIHNKNNNLYYNEDNEIDYVNLTCDEYIIKNILE